MNSQLVERRCQEIRNEISRAVIVDDEVLTTILAGFLADGHVLLEDVPGTGKTLTARTIADVLGLSFSRIQFTPDLLPSDVTGTEIFNEQTRTFEFQPGPLFANIVLADEINRASPKTQAALLEAMAEGQVTVGNESHELPTPFFVIATQNPIESEGTFELPEAQKDRLIIKTSLGYPTEEGELELLDRRSERRSSRATAERICSPEDIEQLRAAPESVRVSGKITRYIVSLVRETRADDRVETGVSPRGTQRLFEITRARAAIDGRSYATPDDVKNVAPAALAHRIVLTPEAKIEGVEARRVIEDILDSVPVPTITAEAR